MESVSENKMNDMKENAINRPYLDNALGQRRGQPGMSIPSGVNLIEDLKRLCYEEELEQPSIPSIPSMSPLSVHQGTSNSFR